MTWSAWSDGSCVHNNATGVFRRGRGYGGWAAVVEHGSDGFVLRGREANVTSSRMELEGAFAALEAIPNDEAVVLHVDCTVLLSVREAWVRSKTEKVDWARWRDHDMWRKIAAEFDRIDVRISLVVKGQIDRVHQRCHSLANAEARSLYGGKPAPQRPRRFVLPAVREKPLSVLAQFEKEREEFERRSQPPPFPTSSLTRKHDGPARGYCDDCAGRHSATGWHSFDTA